MLKKKNKQLVRKDSIGHSVVYDDKIDFIKKEGKNNYMKYLFVLIYLVLTVSGLILYKKGTSEEFLINFSNGFLNVKLSLISILGLVCYLCSFLMYMIILPQFDLTYIYPLMSSISYVGIYILSIFILNESVTVTGVVGSVIIMVGILLMNIGK